MTGDRDISKGVDTEKVGLTPATAIGMLISANSTLTAINPAL